MKKIKDFNVADIDLNSGQKYRKESSKGGNVTVRDRTPALIKARSGATEGVILKSDPSKTED